MRLIPGFKSITFMLMLGLSGTLLAGVSNVNVEYDQDKDRIRIQANNASLTKVLAEIAKKTGMTIQIDPAVEKKVSFQLLPQSLQKALQKVCKGLSYVIEYKTEANQRTVISSMKLLPEGKQDSGQLVSVAVLNARAGRSHIGRNDGDYDTSPGGRYISGSRQRKTTSNSEPTTNNRKRNLIPDDMTAQGERDASESKAERNSIVAPAPALKQRQKQTPPLPAG